MVSDVNIRENMKHDQKAIIKPSKFISVVSELICSNFFCFNNSLAQNNNNKTLADIIKFKNEFWKDLKEAPNSTKKRTNFREKRSEKEGKLLDLVLRDQQKKYYLLA